MTEHEAMIVLNAVRGLGNAKKLKLIAQLGSAREVLKLNEASKDERIPREVCQRISEFPGGKFFKDEIHLIKHYNVKTVALGEDGYPELLAQIPDPPMVLYWQGTLPRKDDPSLAIVGSRRASVYGHTMAQKLSGQLAELGVVIVSGMARGIDAAAHQGCLKAGGTTLAVLGNGLTHVYPCEHRELMAQIAQQGAVISEFPMTYPPRPGNFPRRNRIVSGLSLAVVVVEASDHSGALITSRLALEQGRDVLAVPGQVDRRNAQGTNGLIQQGAKLINGFEDILEELRLPIRRVIEKPGAQDRERRECGIVSPGSEFSDYEQKVYQHIDQTPVYIDELAARCRFSVTQVMGTVIQLQIKHAVKQLPGQFFVRN